MQFMKWLLLMFLAIFAVDKSFGKPAKPESATTSGIVRNPVIPGFAPDPSIVRVGQDFYIVNSSFEYFPALPIYKSRDLVNWRLIGHALADPKGSGLQTVESSGGVQAATIRYHQGIFYIVTTSVVDGKLTSFIVTAKNPEGPWSAPKVISDAAGIDPSLFFDEDGRVWYTANWIPPDPQFEGQAEIWLQELDLKHIALKGPRYFIGRGCCQGVWAEGPHIYKRQGQYYLLIAEGGTSYEHAVSISVADNITGPYKNNPRNPVLTHRNLSYDHPITGIGHADLVELEDGRWYAVALGWRLLEGRHGILGRETFLLPVTWESEREWWKEKKMTFPVFSPDSGKVESEYPLPFPESPQIQTAGFRDDFNSTVLNPEWTFRRAPIKPIYSLSESTGRLRLYLQPGAFSERTQYSFVGIRQRHFQFEASTAMTFSPNHNEEAGLVIVQKDSAAYTLTLASSDNAQYVIRVSKMTETGATVLTEHAIPETKVFMKVKGNSLVYQFYYSLDGKSWLPAGPVIDGSAFSPAILRGFNYTGVFIGLYGTSNGQPTQNYADFDWFDYNHRPVNEISGLPHVK